MIVSNSRTNFLVYQNFLNSILYRSVVQDLRLYHLHIRANVFHGIHCFCHYPKAKVLFRGRIRELWRLFMIASYS